MKKEEKTLQNHKDSEKALSAKVNFQTIEKKFSKGLQRNNNKLSQTINESETLTK